MGKVNALWMDENIDLESHDVTGMSVIDEVPISKFHQFDGAYSGAFCEKCGKSLRGISDDHGSTNLPDCTGIPKIEPMVRVMKVRAR